jgi:hypothetical protein
MELSDQPASSVLGPLLISRGTLSRKTKEINEKKITLY